MNRDALFLIDVKKRQFLPTTQKYPSACRYCDNQLADANRAGTSFRLIMYLYIHIYM